MRNIFDRKEIEDEELDLSEISFKLELLKKHPIAINQATRQELQQIIFLSPIQISNLLHYVQEAGPLLNLLEIQAIDGFDIELVEALMPLLKLNKSNAEPTSAPQPYLHKAYLRFGTVLENPKGYLASSANKYLGDKNKILLKYSLNAKNKISVNLTMEKDAGEPYLSKKSNIPDFSSASIALYDVWKIRKIIVGDYNLQFGQGLTLWTGFSLGKGADIIGLVKNEIGSSTYSSANEINFLRGLTFSIAPLKNILITPFISARKLDATVHVGTEENLFVTTVSSTGLHRTNTEIEQQSSLSNFLMGTAIQYNKQQLQLTAVAYRSHYGFPYAVGDQIYQQFNFSGDRLLNMGFAYGYTFKNAHLFGEISKSDPGSIAVVNGILLSVSPTVSISALHRYYPVKYYNFYSNALGENQNNQNETGLYMGLNLQLNRRLKFSFYFDDLIFPWLKYRVNKPENALETLAQLEYSPNRTDQFSLRYKYTKKPQNQDNGIGIHQILHYEMHSFKLQSNFKMNTNISFKTGLQYIKFTKNNINEHGFSIHHDMRYNLGRSFSNNFRIAFFKTSFNTRTYNYEQDVLHAGGFAMYNGSGWRLYKNVKYNLSKHLNLWLRYAIFLYPNGQSVSSGMEEIAGNKKQDIKLQVIYTF